MPIRYATGLAYAPRATPALAERAVAQALQRLDTDRAAMVLLFLSADFARDPRPALRAAAGTAQTLSVAGCTAAGVMTDEDWLLDTPAACAMVADQWPGPDAAAARLTLAAPDALDIGWLEAGGPRVGGVAGDATGLGPYQVWRQGQLSPDGRSTLPLALETHGISRAMQPVGEPCHVSHIDGFDLHRLDGAHAAHCLRQALDPLPPLHELGLATLDERGRIMACWPLVSINPDGSVTVAARLFPHQRVIWLRRSAEAAVAEITHLVRAPAPAAALLFSCGSRGPALHAGQDKEWRTITRTWPDTPLAGFYGNGQIASLDGSNRLLHQSVVLARLAS
ncbi:FIST C-terminal domain-containing protein [Chitinimonas sp. BJYL2]|uniref:FIST C-terminal domain-containing protein n=1 Tax=Chitinimonas sp. BJYL2 TaxID=2976696 RepID=UPI0022B53C48|nr:FIST C-terminal domain-containing protein [Chitinimonas sp. BJYL2]